MSTPYAHLAAFSSLLARDEDAGRLNTRHVQLVSEICAHAPISIGELAIKSHLSPSQTSRLVDFLTERGFISRTVNPSNRRISLLEPTPAGRALDSRVRAHFVAATAA